MKTKLIIVLPLLLVLFNCNEQAIKKEVTPEQTTAELDKYSELNSRLKKAENIDTPIELIKYYYGEDEHLYQYLKASYALDCWICVVSHSPEPWATNVTVSQYGG